MPFGGLGSLLSIGSSIAGIGGALGGLFGGTPSQNVQGYTNQNMQGADQGAYSGIGNLSNYNVAAQNLPQYQQLMQQGVNNPYASMYQQGAGTTGQGMFGGGAGIAGTALGQLPNVQALMTMGFDPQNALYAQQQNQNQQQNAAILGQSGVAGTPYGAGVQQQGNTNFNLGWENQQLGRASQAAGAASGLMGSISNNAGAGFNMMQQGAGLPYNTFQGINANALGTLAGGAQYGQMAQSGYQQQISDYLQYLQSGQQQQQTNLNQQNQVFNQQQQLGSQLGGGLAGLGKAMSGWGGGGATGWGNGGGGFATNQWGQNNPGVPGSAFYGPPSPGVAVPTTGSW